MKPDFFCAGFGKCGTTTLYEILNQHKDIYLSAIKEPAYYLREDLYKKGFSWYKQRYYGEKNLKRKNKNLLIGEVSPFITMGFNARKISKDFGKTTKFIFIMRNPVDRLYSDFKMHTLWGELCINSQEALLDFSESFYNFVNRNFQYDEELKRIRVNSPHWRTIYCGRYYEHISRFLEYYPIENMKFIIFEEFIKNPKQKCEEIFEFLGLEKDEHIDFNIKMNSGKRRPRNEAGIHLCRLWVKEIWFNQIIPKVPYINYNISSQMNKFYWNMLDWISEPDNSESKLDSETRKFLEEYYREDKENLEKLLDRNLQDIWY